MKKLLVFLLFLLASALSAQSGARWLLARHPNNQEKIKDEIARVVQRGLIPVGISLSGEHVYILYLQDATLRFSAWAINWYDDAAILRDGLTARLEAGFLPTGIHFDGEQFFVLSIKTAIRATHWELVPSTNDLEALKTALAGRTAQGYLPMDLASRENRIWCLLLRAPDSTKTQWAIRTYRGENSSVTPGIDGMVAAGWLPWGLDFDGETVRILYIK